MDREIIAILRGVKPDEVLEIGAVLIAAGISKIEVPLNSPDPFESISMLVQEFGSNTLIGAGTVLTVADVDRLADIGGQMVVSPDCNADVICQTKARAMLSYPGVITPTEAFCALRNGANGLKIFPSFLLGLEGLKALSAVLPLGTDVYAVGGVGPDNFAPWFKAGARGFGIGSGIYKAGMSASDVGVRASEIVAGYDAATHAAKIA